MKAYWQSLTPREQGMLALLAGALVLVMLYFAVLLPLNTYRHDARQSLISAERVYETVANAVQMVERSGEDVPTPKQSVRVTLSQLSRDKGVVINRIQPDADGVLTIWVEGVKATNLYDWLHSLESDHGIAPIKVTIQKTGAAGLLRGQLQFREIGV